MLDVQSKPERKRKISTASHVSSLFSRVAVSACLNPSIHCIARYKCFVCKYNNFTIVLMSKWRAQQIDSQALEVVGWGMEGGEIKG